MKISKLVTYLTQIGRYEQRIQICREILAHNMNFSPAWLIALMKQKEGRLQNKQQKQGENNNITISQFRLFFTLIGLVCQDNELIYVFQYFDNRNTGLIKNQHFLQGLLPTLKEGLRKAVLKRTEVDVELTLELKHALRRIFTQIMKAKSQLRLYQGQFSSTKSTQTSPQIQRQSIQKFLQKFNKHMTQSELTLTYNFLVQGRTKQISLNQICNIIQQSNKQIEYFAKNPTVLEEKIQNQILNTKFKELEGVREVEKIIRKGKRDSQFYARGDKNSAAFFNDTIENMQRSNKVIPNLQTPSSHSDKGRNVENKSQSPLFNLNGNFKIQRTNSIMQNIEDKSQPDIKRAEKLADQLLCSNKNKEETPFKRIQETQIINKRVGKASRVTQQTPMIYYSRRKTSHSDVMGLINNNIEMQEQIQRRRKQNTQRMQQNKHYLGIN